MSDCQPLPDAQQTMDELMLVAPPIPKRQRTTFDISGTGKREVVMSNWYRYFLDAEEDHGLGDVFLRSLLQLLGRNGTFKSYQVATEIPTKRKKRIDILISGTGTESGRYIIIENKIFHWLHNDLADYWQHIKCDDDNKEGVLLTLKHEPVPSEVCKWYHNIRHINWITLVENKIKEEQLDCKQPEYLHHFINAIKNLDRYTNMSECNKFYFNNSAKINMLISYREETMKFVAQQVELASGDLTLELSATDSPRHRIFNIPAYKELLIYGIVWDQLFTDQHQLRITLGLGSKSFNRKNDLDSRFAEKARQQGFGISLSSGSGWHNYLTKIYTINEADFGQLNTFIVQKINDDFSKLTEEIGDFLVGKLTYI